MFKILTDFCLFVLVYVVMKLKVSVLSKHLKPAKGFCVS